jgi:hypothetical protein
MDWNYPINKYFELTEEQQDECIVELAKFYSKRFISRRTKELFEFTLNDLITRLDLEHKHGVDTENYERAEIFYRLTQIFMEIQYEGD